MQDFCHLHCHTQYSLLDGASSIPAMMDKAVRDGQKGVALTDHGNMFGAFKFVAEANKSGIKPIIGCEFYLVEDRFKKSFSRAKGEYDKRYHQLLLAKNRKGYQNLCKLASLGYIDGQYGKFPRIDKELLEKYSEGLIASSCCIGAEIPQTILSGDLEKAEEILKWYINIFGEDYYIELQRHKGLDNIDIRGTDGKPIMTGKSQEDVNQILLGFAKKYNLKAIATNDSHYIEEEDSNPHDVLLCVNTGSLLEEDKRFKFPSSDFYFKTKEEMNQLFGDVPSAIENTMEIYEKVETLELARDVLLPAFPIPKPYKTEDEFLRHITMEGALKRYGTISAEIQERIDFELNVIKNSGYPGYFLIVQDFTTVARQMDVAVGPGRGSAAGSVVAYCLGITNIDPIKYDLLFERFLNPERVSMPDIDIDFDDEGRDKVINYVVEKYGRNQVAQIITYGTMAAKSSLRDVGRVMDVPLYEVDRVAKTFPQQLGAKLNDVLEKDGVKPKLKGKLNGEDLERAQQFRELAFAEDKIGDMIRTAKRLEGSIRNTGIHACGIVITPDDITNYVPVSTAKDNELLVSQFDNSVAEKAGLLKMDFLGLRTLSIIKDAIKLVKLTHNVEIIADDIPLDDPKTYELFQEGATIGIFQYESAGMQRYMKELKPTQFEDLIAMNALYRPGPLQYIPNFIARKHGKEPITYDLPEMEEYLKETYGITVYQEQVMLLSQKLAGFSKGEADMLRKAMGKKIIKLLNEMHPKFINGGKAKGHPEEVLEKIWKDWEAFASYAFNKSHSTCYAAIAVQTAYLKANYPAEFMASVLTHNKNDISKITFFLRECKRSGLTVLGPDINESYSDFTVNKEGQIRFGMSALKGVGEGPVDEIIEERKNGPFKTIIDITTRLNSKAANKKVLESLVLGGALDCFEDYHRAQYFRSSDKFESFIEHALKYGNAFQDRKAESTMSLFGEMDETQMPPPVIPECSPWSLIEKLEKEKQVTGIYISGHPLDDYQMEIDNFTTCSLDRIEQFKKRTVKIGAIVTKTNHRISQKGTGWGIFTVQDFNSMMEIKMFKDDYQKFKSFFEPGQCLFITGIYEPTWSGDDWMFKVKDVTLLESVAEQMANSITLKLPVEKLSDDLVDKIEEIMRKHKGKHKIRFKFLDNQNRESLSFSAKKKTVNVDNDLVTAFEKIGVACQVS